MIPTQSESAGNAGRPHIVRYLETGQAGYIPAKKPWIQAARPCCCPNCGADAQCHLLRMEPCNDGWYCQPCGWTLFDPGIDADRQIISKAGIHQRAKPGESKSDQAKSDKYKGEKC